MTFDPDESPDNDELDPDFGYMQYNNIDAWQCNVCSDFPHSPTYYFAVHVWAPESGPSSAQRQCIRKLKQLYPALWPTLSSTIVRLHPTLTHADQLATVMRDWVSVHLGEHHERSLELVYDLILPNEGGRGYFIKLNHDYTVGVGVVAH